MTRLCLAAHQLQPVQTHVREGLVVSAAAVSRRSVQNVRLSSQRGRTTVAWVVTIRSMVWSVHPEEGLCREDIAARSAPGRGQHGAKQWGHLLCVKSGGGCAQEHRTDSTRPL
jgi:hypothetical protein